MKKIVIIIYITLFTFILSLPLSLNIQAKSEINNDPYSTYTVGLDNQLVASPLAYEGVYVMNPGLKDPQDLYLDNDDNIYICDKGTQVVYKYDIKTKQYTLIGEGILSAPKGVTLDSQNNIYVADSDLKAVIKFDPLGNVLHKYERPTEPLFGEDSKYQPTKVVVDLNNNLFITSDGNANGIIQLNEDGEFMGYFGPNNVKLTLSLFFKRLMLSKEDRETYASLSPRVTTNLAIDDKNIIYTIIDGEIGVSLKKYSTEGINILNKGGFFSNSYQDIAIDKNNFIYTVDKSSSGVIQVMDPEGNLLFSFGQTKTNSYSMGEFIKAVGIDVDSKGNIWVLDSGGKNIQVFMKTAFATTVMDAVMIYNNGDYDAATTCYQDILRQNASFVFAYIGLGKIEQRLQNYPQALEYFKIANYKSGYSEVFWELRDNWLNRNLGWIIGLVVILILLKIFKVFSRLKQKIKLEKIKEKIQQSTFINELKYLFKVLKHPKDTYYDLKYHLVVKKRTAFILFIIFILINIISDNFIRGYLFRPNMVNDINFAFELLKWGLIIILFVIGNSLISSLQNGEGFFRDIFIGAILAFAPIFLFKIPIDILSNFLTYNEGYIYNILNNILWIWTFFNLLLMVREIHNYTIKELIVNIILTIIAVIILVLLFLVLYILAMQLFEFIIGLFKEGGLRT